MMQRAICALLCLLPGLLLAAADPTQPPGGFVEPVAGVAVDAGNPARLQSVIIRPGKKSLALIDGVTYGVGEMVGDLRVVKITERVVTLRGSQGKEELFLTPDVEVTPVKRKPATNRSEKK